MLKKRKITKKLNSDQKKLLIGLLLGDGTISSNYVFKLSHCIEQKEFLEWKIKLLENSLLKNNGLKTYTSVCGYNEGSVVVYSQLSINATIKALRRKLYKPKKIITRKLLNWLEERELAIWYMDDGHLNINTSKQRSSYQYSIKIATCVDINTVNMIIEYFQERWDITFRPFKEGKGTYSISTSTKEDAIKFIEIVKPYIYQLPTMYYKIRKDLTKEEFIRKQHNGFEMRDTIF